MRQETKILLVAFAVVLVALVLAFFAMRASKRPVQQNQATTMQVWQVTLCYPDLKASKLVKLSLSVGATSMERVVSEIFERLKSPDSPDLSPAVPAGAKLLSVRREGDILVLDVSDEFTQPEFWQGSDVAHLRLQALVHTLTSLPQIRAVRILVNGQIPEALGGHEELSEPIEPDPTL
ncbi:MAG: GerMN domain-containing protein [Armatimonadetes bacterium]|jgi:spore germination protein GerM|nr:GerMN domain-containing protein [Armatimonadota bacterium]